MSLIYKAIPTIMGEVGAIEKNRQGTGLSYKFRGIDDIYSAMQPLLSKHKVTCAPNVTTQHREERTTKSGSTMIYTILTVEFTFFAEDGSNLKVVTVGEAMDTSDKSSNKAMSAAMKYAMLQLFCIPTEEEKDTEYQSPEPGPREPGAFIVTMGQKFKGKRLDACDAYELDSFSKWLSNQPDLKGTGLETRNAIEAYLKTKEVQKAK